MKKKIALIASLDTKYNETIYARDIIEHSGFLTYVIDVSTKTVLDGKADISPVEILKRFGVTWEEFEKMGKADRIETMSKAIAKELPKLYEEGNFDGVISIGGGQNAKMAATAMKELAFGVPKVVASSLACGKRTMEQYVGSKDIVVMHTVADISGLNAITKTSIQTACGAIMGMTEHEKYYKKEPGKKVLAATMLGITTKGTEHALKIIGEHGFETVVFHANGVGGRCMDELIREGRIDAVLDMNLHEITCEVLGGYCVGANNRLMAAIEKKIPMVVVPGALDMIDFFIDEQGNGLPDNIEERKRVYHNSSICHCKLFTEEAEKVVKVVTERLNIANGPITVVLPTKGGCEAAAPEGPMYDPEVDKVIIDTFKKYLDPKIKLVIVDANINEDIFAETVANEVLLIS